MSQPQVFAVLLAGGQGTRLWPLSRRERPKQFLDLTGSGRSLLQEALRRALDLCGSAERVLVLASAAHAALVREQLPDLPQENLLAEPQGRNTAPALGLAAMYLHKISPQAVMTCLPVDHLFVDVDPWLDALRCAVQVAAQSSHLVAVGVTPAHPSSGYGYQHLGSKRLPGYPLPVHQLQGFVEKPDPERARTFVASGEYLWNTGTYVWQVGSFLDALHTHAPAVYQRLQGITFPLDAAQLAHAYARMESISVDNAVLEKATGVFSVQANFERIDVGTLASLPELWGADEHGNARLGTLVTRESRDNIVYSDAGLVALVGVRDLIVVRAGDVLLVCPREQAQQVKQLVSELQRRDMEKFL